MVNSTPVVITRTDWMETDNIFYQSEEEWYVNYNDTQVVTNLDNLPENYCWIRRMPSLGDYLNYIHSEFEVQQEFLGIQILQNE